MKPKNNRVMCPECFRAKMLFETKKQADNFIKWNGKDIDTHGGELRSYFCPACGGYHISSKPYKPSYEHNTENLINRFKELGKSNLNTKKVESNVDRLFNELVENTTSFENPSKMFLRDFLDAYIKENEISLRQHDLDRFRHLLYKRYNKN